MTGNATSSADMHLPASGPAGHVSTRHIEKLRLKSVKPKRWSHQDELTALIGKKILVSGYGFQFTGELLEADQFTVKMRTAETTVRVIFKSALTLFGAA